MVVVSDLKKEMLRLLGRCHHAKLILNAASGAVAAPAEQQEEDASVPAPERMEPVREFFEEAADLARRNRFGLCELLALGELQRLVNVPEGNGKEGEGFRRLEEAAKRMGGKPLSAFESVRNW